MLDPTPTGSPPATRVLTIAGTRLLLDDQPFPFQGLSFFNALYNPTFNRNRPAQPSTPSSTAGYARAVASAPPSGAPGSGVSPARTRSTNVVARPR